MKPDRAPPSLARALPSSGGRDSECCAAVERLLWATLPLWLVTAALSSWFFVAQYVSSVDEAFSSIVYAEGAIERVAGSARDVKWAAEQALVLTLGLLLFVMWWRRTWADGRSGLLSWYAALVSLLVTVKWGFFGQLLPMDQYAWHGTLVRAGIIESTPLLGPWLKQLVLNGDSISGGTLSFFAAMHTSVLPALMLLLACGVWWMRRDHSAARPPIEGNARSAVVELAVFFVLFVPLTFAAHDANALQMAARASASYPDVRPEWYFVPLSKLMAVSGGGFIESLVVLLPGGLVGLLVLWPWIGARLRRGAQITILCSIGAVFFALLAWQVREDRANEKGWFARPDMDTVMGELGKLNESLGRPNDHRLEHAFKIAADLQVLSRLTLALADHKVVKDRAQWRDWSNDLGTIARGIWSSGDPERLQVTIAKLRRTCAACHDAHKEEVELFDTVIARAEIRPIPHPPPTDSTPRNFFHESDFAALRPSGDYPAKRADLMTRMTKQYDLLNGDDTGRYPAAIVELEAQWRELLGRWDADSDDGLITDEQWRAFSQIGIDLMAQLKTAVDAAAFRTGVAAIRRACVTCHDEIGVEDAEIKPTRE